MTEICVWADGTWCFKEDIEQYSWMSDDYAILRIPAGCDDEAIDNFVKIGKF